MSRTAPDAPTVASPVATGPGTGTARLLLPAMAGPGPSGATRRPRWWLELLVIVWLAWVYDLITNLAALRQHAALAHGLAVLHLEATLHLDPEEALNHWLHGHPLLGVLAGDYYDNAHFIVTFAVIGWLWWRHPRQYRPLRTTLVLVNVVGFIVYWLWPMAPPRLLPGGHFYDIVALTHAIGGWHTGTLSAAANQFASMPSLHLAWAMWSAAAVWLVFRHRRAARLAWLYPAFTVVVVMATANHFLTDCVAGVATVGLAAAVAFPLDRALRRRAAHRAGVSGRASTGGQAPVAGQA